MALEGCFNAFSCHCLHKGKRVLFIRNPVSCSIEQNRHLHIFTCAKQSVLLMIYFVPHFLYKASHTENPLFAQDRSVNISIRIS
jgi:hypothetical protein